MTETAKVGQTPKQFFFSLSQLMLLTQNGGFDCNFYGIFLHFNLHIYAETILPPRCGLHQRSIGYVCYEAIWMLPAGSEVPDERQDMSGGRPELGQILGRIHQTLHHPAVPSIRNMQDWCQGRQLRCRRSTAKVIISYCDINDSKAIHPLVEIAQFVHKLQITKSTSQSFTDRREFAVLRSN